MANHKVIEKLTITDISAEGKSVARHHDQVVFITDGVPGDVVDVVITRKKRKFLEGRAIKFHSHSKDRQVPFCEHFGLCGGCKWQHLQYEAQLAYKERHVLENLQRISKTQLPQPNKIIGSKEITFYRNKLEYTFSDTRWLTREEIESGDSLSRNGLGFHIPKRFDKVLDIHHCWLQKDPSNAIRNTIKQYAEDHSLSFFNIREQKGLLRNLIIRTSTTNEVMVILQFFQNDEKAINGILEHVKNKFPEITSLLYVVNEKKNETFFDLPVHTFSGRDHIIEQMENLSFRIGPKSFYQTNPLQAHVLYAVVRDMARLTGSELVYDLYTGTGTIANFIARSAKKVIGIESVEEAVVDARTNSTMNGIDNTLFFAGDMKDLLSPEFIRENGQPDLIITDPPRAGMHENVIQQINQIRPAKLIYVSCNSATQARDLELLAPHYDVKVIQPVDMFPQTHHVENVCLLELR